MRTSIVKGGMTVAGAVLLSTLGIFASDALRGIDVENGANVSGAVCKQGMAPVRVGGALICADIFEASPSKDCPIGRPGSALDTERNMNTENCYPATAKGITPWTYVSLPQAQRLCAKAGKRLPTNAEWYAIALGSESSSCTARRNDVGTTGGQGCISSIGAEDAVGNVWEWVNETVVGRTYSGRELPEEGYVTSVDADGIVVSSALEPDPLYGNDYMWTKSEGALGMIRGGFYGSGEDAGLYALNASVATSFATQGIGFRCVEDVL